MFILKYCIDSLSVLAGGCQRQKMLEMVIACLVYHREDI